MAVVRYIRIGRSLVGPSFALGSVNYEIGEEWFPARCKMVLRNHPHESDGLLVTVDPAFPTAWRREPYYSQLLA